MSYSPRYIVSAGSLVVEHTEDDGSCVDRTIYSPERFAAERGELPSSVVAAYESGNSKNASRPLSSNDDTLIADDRPRPSAPLKSAAKKTAAKKTAAKKTAVKKTTKR